MSATFKPEEHFSFSAFVNNHAARRWYIDYSKKVIIKPDGSMEFALVKK